MKGLQHGPSAGNIPCRMPFESSLCCCRNVTKTLHDLCPGARVGAGPRTRVVQLLASVSTGLHANISFGIEVTVPRRLQG